jgi:hypothetical protein
MCRVALPVQPTVVLAEVTPPHVADTTPEPGGPRSRLVIADVVVVIEG